MKIIKAVNNIDTNVWSIAELDRSPTSLQIDFISADQNKTFDNLKFGFSLKQGKTILVDEQFPPEGISYERAGQFYLIAKDISVPPDKTIELNLWAEHAGVRSEFSYSFKSDKLEQPYPSWIWTGEQWISPTPVPGNAEDYLWNETSKQWILDTED
jgi:hypothetical protein